MYRAATFMVEDEITNPTSPPHKGITACKDLSPVMSECLYSHEDSLSLQEQGEDVPGDGERDQSCKYPGGSAEQEGHSSVIPKCGGEGGEEHSI